MWIIPNCSLLVTQALHHLSLCTQMIGLIHKPNIWPNSQSIYSNEKHSIDISVVYPLCNSSVILWYSFTWMQLMSIEKVLSISSTIAHNIVSFFVLTCPLKNLKCLLVTSKCWGLYPKIFLAPEKIYVLKEKRTFHVSFVSFEEGSIGSNG
jgi:hypothetical protein